MSDPKHSTKSDTNLILLSDYFQTSSEPSSERPKTDTILKIECFSNIASWIPSKGVIVLMEGTSVPAPVLKFTPAPYKSVLDRTWTPKQLEAWLVRQKFLLDHCKEVTSVSAMLAMDVVVSQVDVTTDLWDSSIFNTFIQNARHFNCRVWLRPAIWTGNWNAAVDVMMIAPSGYFFPSCFDPHMLRLVYQQHPGSYTIIQRTTNGYQYGYLAY